MRWYASLVATFVLIIALAVIESKTTTVAFFIRPPKHLCKNSRNWPFWPWKRMPVLTNISPWEEIFKKESPWFKKSIYDFVIVFWIDKIGIRKWIAACSFCKRRKNEEREMGGGGPTTFFQMKIIFFIKQLFFQNSSFLVAINRSTNEQISWFSRLEYIYQ